MKNLEPSAGNKIALIFGLTIALAGCRKAIPSERNLCPPEIQGLALAKQSSALWESKKSIKVSALIVSVAVLCFPVYHPALISRRAGRASFSDYQIAATATVTYQVRDAKWVESAPLGLWATVIFEAVSANGVVLASKHAEFRILPTQKSATISASITGLSESEIQHVALVRARWQYGG